MKSTLWQGDHLNEETYSAGLISQIGTQEMSRLGRNYNSSKAALAARYDAVASIVHCDPDKAVGYCHARKDGTELEPYQCGASVNSEPLTMLPLCSGRCTLGIHLT